MSYTILGAGMMGSAIAQDFLETTEDPIILIDFDKEKLEDCNTKFRSNRLTFIQLDITDSQKLRKAIEGTDILICALTHSWELSRQVTLAALDVGCHLIDLDPMGWDERLTWDERAKKLGIEVMVGMGVTPGLSNILLMRTASHMDEIDSGVIRCGGLPQDYPAPPLDYRLVFSFEGVISLYTSKPMVIENGEICEIAPLSGLEELYYPDPINRHLQCINTDGLTTLVKTMKTRGIKNLHEKTIRNPGHVDKIKAFIDVGLFDEDPIDNVIPRKFFSKLITPQIKMSPKHRDFTILHVEATGSKEGQPIRVNELMIDRFDEVKNLTSMARTTGYPVSIAAQMLKRGMINSRGVTPIEEIFVGRTFDYLIGELKKRGISIEEKVERNKKL